MTAPAGEGPPARGAGSAPGEPEAVGRSDRCRLGSPVRGRGGWRRGGSRGSQIEPEEVGRAPVERLSVERPPGAVGRTNASDGRRRRRRRHPRRSHRRRGWSPFDRGPGGDGLGRRGLELTAQLGRLVRQVPDVDLGRLLPGLGGHTPTLRPPEPREQGLEIGQRDDGVSRRRPRLRRGRGRSGALGRLLRPPRLDVLQPDLDPLRSARRRPLAVGDQARPPPLADGADGEPGAGRGIALEQPRARLCRRHGPNRRHDRGRGRRGRRSGRSGLPFGRRRGRRRRRRLGRRLAAGGRRRPPDWAGSQRSAPPKRGATTATAPNRAQFGSRQFAAPGRAIARSAAAHHAGSGRLRGREIGSAAASNTACGWSVGNMWTSSGKVVMKADEPGAGNSPGTTFRWSGTVGLKPAAAASTMTDVNNTRMTSSGRRVHGRKANRSSHTLGRRRPVALGGPGRSDRPVEHLRPSPVRATPHGGPLGTPPGGPRGFLLHDRGWGRGPPLGRLPHGRRRRGRALEGGPGLGQSPRHLVICLFQALAVLVQPLLLRLHPGRPLVELGHDLAALAVGLPQDLVALGLGCRHWASAWAKVPRTILAASALAAPTIWLAT